MRRSLPLTLLLLALAASACTATESPNPNPSPQPAGAPSPQTGPDALTRMVCEDEVRLELKAALGVDTPQPPTATWAEPTFTCAYAYSDGKLTMTVREQPDKAATEQYFTAKRDAAAQRKDLPGLGEAAFALPDGSIYLRKDEKVMFVDVSGLPDQFGQPPVGRERVALAVVATVMHCWIEVN